MIAEHYRSTPAPSPPYKLAACAIFKDEYHYVLEWVWYHILLGFQHFWLYDNGSTDGGQLLLNPLIGLGYVTLIDFPSTPDKPWARQTDQLAHCFNTSFEAALSSEWLTDHDIDEFPFVDGAEPSLAEARGLVAYPLHRLLDSYAASGVGAIIADRYSFDSNGLVRPNYDASCHTCSGLMIKDYYSYIIPDPWHQPGKVFQLARSLKSKGFPQHTATVNDGFRIVTADMAEWSSKSKPVFHPLCYFHYDRRSYVECQYKVAHSGQPKSNDWRALNPKMCDKSLVGMPEYEPKRHALNTNLSESFFPDVLIALKVVPNTPVHQILA